MYLSSHQLIDRVSDSLGSFVRSPDGDKLQSKVWKELEAKLEAIQPGIIGTI